MPHEVELLVDAKAGVGEGPIWDVRRQVLVWVSILAGEIHIYDPATKQDRVIDVGQQPGTVVMRKSGGMMLGVEKGFAAFDPDTGKLDIWSDPESDKPGNRFNDGKCDPAGRFWAGTMAYDGDKVTGSLYCLDTDGTVRKMVDGVTISNGIAWSTDGRTMYYIDSIFPRVDGFDYDVETGRIENRRTVIQVPQPREGVLPDGMTIDAEGNLWVAFWGGSSVVCFDPRTGKTLDRVDLPVSQVSACWFGGPDLMDLYITTARQGMDDAQLACEPLAGALFRARPGARGVEAVEFGG